MTTTTAQDVRASEETSSQPKRRPPRSSRRFGYSISLACNVILIYLINEWPGWQSLNFVTNDASKVIPFLNASLVIGAVINAVYLAADPRWLRAIGEAISAAVSFVVIAMFLNVFPFDFSAYSFNWDVLVRVFLIIGLVGTVIGVITNLVTFVREIGRV